MNNVDREELKKIVKECMDEILNEDSNPLESAKSQFTRLFGHMLKYIYQPEKQYSEWIRTIRNANSEIIDLTSSKKTVANYTSSEEFLNKAYNRAIRLAVGDTGLPKSKFPQVRDDEIFSYKTATDRTKIEKFLYEYATEKTLKYLQNGE